MSLINQLKKTFSQGFSVVFFFPDLIRSIFDPEHPHTLEELNVVEHSKVKVSINLYSCYFLIKVAPKSKLKFCGG